MLCGGITVLIQRMSAVFGRLRNETLQLQDGLNIIEAPNETGKSTWCAFLTAMLYGINSRERDKAGFIADKNRYAPWDGGSMSGRLECHADGADITLTGLAIAALAGVILNAILPGNDYEFGTDPQGDKSADLGSY